MDCCVWKTKRNIFGPWCQIFERKGFLPASFCKFGHCDQVFSPQASRIKRTLWKNQSFFCANNSNPFDAIKNGWMAEIGSLCLLGSKLTSFPTNRFYSLGVIFGKRPLEVWSNLGTRVFPTFEELVGGKSENPGNCKQTVGSFEGGCEQESKSFQSPEFLQKGWICVGPQVTFSPTKNRENWITVAGTIPNCWGQA